MTKLYFSLATLHLQWLKDSAYMCIPLKYCNFVMVPTLIKQSDSLFTTLFPDNQSVYNS